MSDKPWYEDITPLKGPIPPPTPREALITRRLIATQESVERLRKEVHDQQLMIQVFSEKITSLDRTVQSLLDWHSGLQRVVLQTKK